MSYRPIHAVEELHQRLVAGATREDHWLELKADLGPNNAEIARDVAQFANASGGTLIVGAEESAQVFSRYRNLDDPSSIATRLDDIVKDHLTPVPLIECVVVRPQDEIAVVIANIPPSARLVARHENHQRYEFVARAGESKRFMSLLEVEARMHGGERLARLRLERIRSDDSVALDAMLYRIDHFDWNVTVVDDDSVTLRKGALEAQVPLAYVNAVYRAKNPGTQWVLDLSCYITWVTDGGDFIHVSKSKPLHVGELKYRTRRFARG